MSDTEDKAAKAGAANLEATTLDELNGLFPNSHEETRSQTASEKVNRSDSSPVEDDLDLSFLGMEFSSRKTAYEQADDLNADTFSSDKEERSSLLTNAEFSDILADIEYHMTGKTSHPSTQPVASAQSDLEHSDNQMLDEQISEHTMGTHGATFDTGLESPTFETSTINESQEIISDDIAEQDLNQLKDNTSSNHAVSPNAAVNNVFDDNSFNEFYDVPPPLPVRQRSSFVERTVDVAPQEVNAAPQNEHTEIRNETFEEEDRFFDSEESPLNIGNEVLGTETAATIPFEDDSLHIGNADELYSSHETDTENFAPINESADNDYDLTSPLFIDAENNYQNDIEPESSASEYTSDANIAFEQETAAGTFDPIPAPRMPEREPLSSYLTPFPSERAEEEAYTLPPTDLETSDQSGSFTYASSDEFSMPPFGESDDDDSTGFSPFLTDDEINLRKQPEKTSFSYNEPKLTQSSSMVDFPSELEEEYSPISTVPDDDFDNSSEISPSSYSERKATRASDNFGDKMDSLLNKNVKTEPKTTRPLNRDSSYTAQRQSTYAPRQSSAYAPTQGGVIPPEVETYQFDDSLVEKTETFDIPAVAYEEQEKSYSDPFEQEFDDVFNVGATTAPEKAPVRGSIRESQDEFFKSATDNRSSHNYQASSNAYADAPEPQQQEWDRYEEDKYYPDESDNWDNRQERPSYYDNENMAGGGIKKIGLIGAGLAALLIVFGGGYYYLNNHSKPSDVITIHADNTPIKVSPNNSQAQNNTTVNTSSGVSGQPQNGSAQQRELVDNSETPQNLANAAPSMSSAGNISNSQHVEEAITAGASNSVPTNVTIAVVVRPDGTFATEPIQSSAVERMPGATVPGEDRLMPESNMQTQSSANVYNTSNNRFVIEPSVLASAIRPSNTAEMSTTVQQQQINNQVQQPINQVQQQPVNQVQQRPVNQVQQSDMQTQNVPAAGGFYVQISSQPNEDQARIELNAARSRFSSIIAGRQLEIQRANLPGKGIYYRVRIAAGSRENANSLCLSIRSAGGSCFITR